MAAQRWEIRSIYVPLTPVDQVDRRGDYTITQTWSDFGDKSKAAWEEGKNLANDGWELVAVVPRLQAFMEIAVSSRRGTSALGAGVTFDRGWSLFFKRPID